MYRVSGMLNFTVRGSSESDFCRRQILTSKVDPRTVKIKIIVAPSHRYLNEAEKAN